MRLHLHLYNKAFGIDIEIGGSRHTTALTSLESLTTLLIFGGRSEIDVGSDFGPDGLGSGFLPL